MRGLTECRLWCSPDFLHSANQIRLWMNVLHSSVQVHFQHSPDVFGDVDVLAWWRPHHAWNNYRSVFSPASRSENCALDCCRLGKSRGSQDKNKKKNLLQRLATSFALESPHTWLRLCCPLRMSLHQCKKCTGKSWHGSEHKGCEHGDIQGRINILFIMFSPHTFLSFLNTTWVSSEKNHFPPVCMHCEILHNARLAFCLPGKFVVWWLACRVNRRQIELSF